MDKLIVKGLLPIDGEYEFDLVALLTVGSQGALTNRELHRVKTMSGVRAGELIDAFTAGDNDVLIALAAIILSRAGKRVDEERLWDAPMGSGISFDIEERREEDEEEDGEESLPPASEPPADEPTETRSPSGGESSKTTSENQASVPSRTGPRLLETPSQVPDSGQETLAS